MTATVKNVATPWQIYKRLLGYARRYQLFLGLGFLGMIVEALCAGVFTWLMKPIVDETIIARNPEVSLTLPLAIVGLFLVRGLATFVTDYGMARSGRSVVRDLRTDVLRKYLHLPSSRFDIEPVPMMVSRLNYDTESVNQSTSEAIKVVVTDTLSIVVQLVVMLVYSPIVTLTMLVVAPLIASISGYVSRRYRSLNRSIQEGVANLAHNAEETLAAQQEVKIYGAQDKANERYVSLANKNLKLSLKVEVTRAAASSAVQLLAAVALSVILIVAGREAAAGNLTAGAFVSIVLAMMAMLPSLKRITNVQSPIQRGIAAAERLFGVLDEPEESDRGSVALEHANGNIEFRDVSMRYSSQNAHALSNISFTAKPGTVTAIVGRSGSGKSTLIRLLPRFYEASTGQILLDGVPITEYRLNDLRRQIALVGQKVMLFDDTIAANIAYGSNITDEASLRRAADAANASEFINKLPDGLQTRIGENGSLLSGGQRQRLAIARAILKDAPILILDEATAALDNESERLVQDALNHLIPDKTTLVIAHRLSTIEHADQVLVFDDGRLVEQGTHAQLLAKGGVYAHLHSMQFRNAEPA
ncbi:MAG TPA: lipid A export permease/ATP-binding protein MsbA [Arenimonas sp.]|nr:lipid A export permease/ATP-binding protein MsbA [Arenimonas sp.]HPW31738.1 lipid A export permease/ATP-binding protein MsbA [Arenimonas sp.]